MCSDGGFLRVIIHISENYYPHSITVSHYLCVGGFTLVLELDSCTVIFPVEGLVSL